MFTSDEIDDAIKYIPSNKSHVPNGFHTGSMKDLYDLCSQFHEGSHPQKNFHEGSLCIQSINAFLITLIPKVDGLSG